MRKRLLSALLLFAAAGPAAAQESGPPRPCLKGGAFDAFDFWVGEWEVYNLAKDRAHAGHNRIVEIQDNCALQEFWKGDKGGTGTSINWYNPLQDQWRQIWISPFGVEIDIAGNLNDAGAMVLTGRIEYYDRGESAPFRGTWTPNADGTVRQTFEQQNSDTGEWTVWFDGLYVRPEAQSE